MMIFQNSVRSRAPIAPAARSHNGLTDRTPAQAGMKLRTTPRRPHYLPTIAVRGMGAAAIPEAWRPYWTGALEE